MTDSEIYELLWDDDPYNHPAWDSFKENMQTKQYGRDPLNQAWWFFRQGWEANERKTSKTP